MRKELLLLCATGAANILFAVCISVDVLAYSKRMRFRVSLIISTYSQKEKKREWSKRQSFFFTIASFIAYTITLKHAAAAAAAEKLIFGGKNCATYTTCART